MRGLIDASAIVALIDKRDAWHARTVASFDKQHLPMGTTAAVLAETFHLLASHEHEAAWRLIASGAVSIEPITSADAPMLRKHMSTYSDVPMDFADATLVLLAERHRANLILSLDRDFLIYRIEGKKSFRVLPER